MKTPFGSFYFFNGFRDRANYGYGSIRSKRAAILWLGRIAIGWTATGSVFHSTNS